MRDYSKEEILITSWMINPKGLNLKGTNLEIYGLIYSITQQPFLNRLSINQQFISFPISHLIDFLGISRRSALYSLQYLKKKKLIIPKINKGNPTSYQVNAEKISKAINSTSDYFNKKKEE